MKVYLGDLTHYTLCVTNNHTPLNIGFLASFVKNKLQGNVDIKLYKNPEKLADISRLYREIEPSLNKGNYATNRE